MKKISLSGKWHGCGIYPESAGYGKCRELHFEGEVPGCVHTDLLREGIIKDPFYRYNGDECQWIENCGWYYERAFELSDAEYAALNKNGGALIVFEGLDVYCDVFLNGVRIGSADNMNIEHRFPIAKAAVRGTNTLRVVFYSPIALTAGRPARSAAFTAERLYTRRMQCTYYWDWVNRYVTFGIFRPCYLLFPDSAELKSVYLYTRHIDREERTAQIGAEFEFEVHSPGAYLAFTVTSPSGKVVYRTARAIVEELICEPVDIPDAELWYPAGYGAQPLYTIDIGVYSDSGMTVLTDSRRMKLGLRTVRLLQLPDKPGSEYYSLCEEIKKGGHVSGQNAFWDRNDGEYSGFICVVNGVRIMCRGANWVPSEPFPSAETEEKLTSLLETAALGGANMIRVWGGGIFECDHFYDECDRLGLLVTQDFLMACGDYPEDDEYFLLQQKREAEYAARRLRSHTCLAWWSGDNENGMDADENMPVYKGRRSALGTIQPVLRLLDPHRDFLPSSPYRGIPYGSITRGTTHNTNYIGEWFQYIRYNELFDYKEYFDRYLTRFCAEEPVMGAPQISSLRRFMTDGDIFGGDDAIWRYHTKNNPADAFREFEIFDYLKAIAEKLFGPFRSGTDKVLKLEYTQYEWVRITMELYRRRKWFSAGLIYWMLNDCWPASGWALIDYYGLPKAGWYGFMRASRPVIASIDRRDGQYSVWLCNDSLSAADVRFRLYLHDTASGVDLFSEEASASVPANTSVCALNVEESRVSALFSDTAILLCDLIAEDGALIDCTCCFEHRPQDVRFPETRVEMIARTGDTVTLRADRYCHAVMLDGDYVYSDNCFILKAGEERTVSLRKARVHTDGAVMLNWLGKKSLD